MHILVYTSQYCGNESDFEQVCCDISKSADRFNLENELTGVLLSDGNTFIQILEGEEAQLLKLQRRLEKDIRHSNLQELHFEAIPKRDFHDWKMDIIAIDKLNQTPREKILEFRDLYKHNFKIRAAHFTRHVKEMLLANEIER